jgi:hypothetical protein
MVVDNVGRATKRQHRQRRAAAHCHHRQYQWAITELDIRYIFGKQISLISTMGTHRDFREVTAPSGPAGSVR